MNRSEAITLINTAPEDNKKSKVNPSLTRYQVTKIIKDALKDDSSRIFDSLGNLGDLYEKRVWQAVKDQRRPKY